MRHPPEHAFADSPPSSLGGAEEAAWLRGLLEAAPEAALLTDSRGEVAGANGRFVALWGLPAESLARPDRGEALDHVARRLLDPEGFFQRWDEILRQAEPESEDLLELADGRVVERRSRPLRVGERLLGRLWSFRDATSARRAAESLREREERLRAILNQAAVGIAIAGLDLFFLEANRRFEEIVSYSAGELRKMTFVDLTYPEDREEARRMARRLLSGEIAENTVEKRYLARDGRQVWGRTTITLIRDAQGAPRQFVGLVQDITARRHAEEALLRNEAELRALADSMAQLAWMAEPDGHIFWYNRRWFEYTGGSLEHMRGWGWQTVHDPALLPQVLRRWREAIAAGSPWEMEFPLRGADGRFRWFLTRAIPVRDGAGRVTRWFGTSTDVDRAKRAEDALREETRVLELLNRTGTEIAAQLDLECLLRRVTDAGTELSGARFGAFFYTEAKEGGRGEGGFVLHACAGAPPEELARACEGRNKFLVDVFRERRSVRREDAPGDVVATGFPPTRSYVAVPVVSRSGEVLGGMFFGHPEPAVFDGRTERVLVGVAAQAAIAIDNARLYESAQREITERARTEQDLRESETRLRVALQTTALGAWALDLRTGRVEMDERCVELFAPAARAEMGFEELIAVAHPDFRATRREFLRRICAGEAERYDMEFRATNGRWVKSSAKPVRDARGEVVRAIGGVLDITETVQARASTEERQRDLERLVEERTASLHQAIAQMEEFSYSVSHDLRAPLRAIQGYAQAVMEDWGERIGPQGREHLARILGAGERMDRLTRDVLTYSRIARGAAPLSQLPLERLVDDAIEQYAPGRRREGVIEVEKPLLAVRGHEALLVQAISNLLANALKFVEEGVTPRVRVRTERRGDQVRLWVEDNGIGVRPEHAARIWGMFERIHPQGKFEGTGIGLAIVRKAVERMGGSAGVESDGERGSRFWLQLQGA